MKNYNIIINRQLAGKGEYHLSSIERWVDKAIEMYLTELFNKSSDYYGGGYEGLGRVITLGFKLSEKPNAEELQKLLIKIIRDNEEEPFKLIVEVEEYKEKD